MRRRTGGRTFQFTIFSTRLHGLQRAYQLTIERFGRSVPNRHQLSHEHFGTQRVELPDNAKYWTFEQALSYFCERANLRIEPPVNDPQELHLQP